MLFINNTTLESDLARFLQMNKIRPTDLRVEELKQELFEARDTGKSILRQLDLFVDRVKSKKQTQQKTIVKASRDYFRESVRRLMRQGYEEKEAEERIAAYRWKQENKQSYLPSKKKDLTDNLNACQIPIWAKVAICTESHCNFFEDIKSAAQFLEQEYNYKSFSAARVTLNRNVEQGLMHKKGWQAFRLNESYTQTTNISIMKTELKTVKNTLTKLNKKLEKIQAEIAALNFNLNRIAGDQTATTDPIEQIRIGSSGDYDNDQKSDK